jgi:hypothetical protein
VEFVWSLEHDKAPRPNGFSIHVFEVFLELVKFDVKKMLNYTLKMEKVVGATNSTFLALIPKEENLATFSHFHQISLCNSAYKGLTKIIGNRLKKFMPKLI